MKLISLSEKLLKYMVTEYKNHGQEMFFSDTFKALCSDETECFISKALYLLQDNKFVSIFPVNDVPLVTTLRPNIIANCEENTMLKKGYTAIKEIKSLIS